MLTSLLTIPATQAGAADLVTANVTFSVYSYYGLSEPNIGSCTFQFDQSTLTELENDCDGTAQIVVGDFVSLSCTLNDGEKETVFGFEDLPGNTWYASYGESGQVENKNNRGPVESGSDDRFHRSWIIGGETPEADQLTMEFTAFNNEKVGSFSFDNHKGSVLIGDFLIDVDAPDPVEDDNFAPATCPSEPVVTTLSGTPVTESNSDNTDNTSGTSASGGGGGGFAGFVLLALAGIAGIRRKLKK
ncbi:MAG: hypothetical protein KDJ38_03890 [Gammaproteobacteria bacterium]|nr:hypothetical protein [Gammaproteobacteria bacterium]